MNRLLSILLILISTTIYAQIEANRFYYELTFRPKIDSTKKDQVIAILDITKNQSLYRDYTSVKQDSLVKARVENMQKTGVFSDDFTKNLSQPKFSYKITKTYPDMQILYSETMLNGISAIQLGYKETPNFQWKIQPETQKIGEYNAQKATLNFGGRDWIAWFSTEIPFQDGPYKFSGLPGLIVKIEDTEKNYSWVLKGNKKISNFDELTFVERMSQLNKKVNEVSREKFEKAFEDYKKDPLASIRPMLQPEVMNQKMPGQNKTVGEMVREQEKQTIEFYNANNNPIELTYKNKK